MAKHAEDAKPGSPGWPPMPFVDPARALAGGERGARALALAQEHCISRLAAMNREVSGFVERRLERDVAHLHALAGCRTLDEMMTLWMKFAEQAARDYTAEMSTIVQLGVTQTQEAVRDLQHEVEATVDPITNGAGHA